MRHVFLVNPVSGKADASLTLVPRIVEACAAAGVDYEIALTEYPGHGARLARQWAETGEPVRLYACGGDGTFNEVLRGAMGWANAAVGCVPCGSGNDFIRNYGTAEQFLNLDAQLNGSEQAIDLMETSAGLCASICAAGLDAQVAYGIPKFRRLPFCGGSMAYKLSIVQNVCGPLGHRLAIQVDDEQLEEDCLMVAICNGSCYGGGFCAAPQASLQDGLLDVIVVRKVSRLRIAKVISLYKTWAHLKNGQVVPELAGLLTDVKVEIYYSGDQPGEMVEPLRRPYRYRSVWDGMVEVWATGKCKGPWIILARANLNGQPVEAATQNRSYLITETEAP